MLLAAAAVGMLAMMPSQKKEPPPAEVPPVNVSVQEVRASELTETFELPAVVEPNCVVKVAAEVAGQIASYGRRTKPASRQGKTFEQGQFIDEGQPIAKGDVLVELDKAILQAERDRAQAESKYSQNEYDRVVDLRKSGAATPRELDEAATKLDVARATLRMAQERLDRATITAPISGILNRLPGEVGEYVQPGQVVAEIVDVNTVKVVVDVPEREVGYLRLGQEETVPLDSGGEEKAIGRISYISELADPQTRATRVEIAVDNARHVLRSGQIVKVRLARRVLPNAIAILLETVLPGDNGRREVYVVKDGLAEVRKVKLGYFFEQKVVVTQGLVPGDQLIVKGHRYVSNGQRVNIEPADGATTTTSPATNLATNPGTGPSR